VDVKLAYLAMAVGQGTDSAPTDAELQQFDNLKKQVGESLSRWAEIERTDLPTFDRLMAGQNIEAIVVPTPERGEVAGGSQH
jgi:hypothetical protein